MNKKVDSDICVGCGEWKDECIFLSECPGFHIQPERLNPEDFIDFFAASRNKYLSELIDNFCKICDSPSNANK